MHNFLRFIILFPQYIFFSIINGFIIRFQHVLIGKSRRISGIIFVRNHGLIKVGDKFTINCNMRGNPVGGPYKSSISVDYNASLTIGNNVGISGTSIICVKNITIDDNVMIGSGCCIYDTDFHAIDYNDRLERVNTKIASVKISEGVFIGARSIILKGVTIGRHSVVGAGSVVTRDIPDNELWAGNPAKFIKKIQ